MQWTDELTPRLDKWRKKPPANSKRRMAMKRRLAMKRHRVKAKRSAQHGE